MVGRGKRKGDKGGAERLKGQQRRESEGRHGGGVNGKGC